MGQTEGDPERPQPLLHREPLTPLPAPLDVAAGAGSAAWYASPVTKALIVTVLGLGNPWVNPALTEAANINDLDLLDPFVGPGLYILRWLAWDVDGAAGSGQFVPGDNIARLLLFILIAAWLAHRVQRVLALVPDPAARGLRLARMFAISGAFAAGGICAGWLLALVGLVTGADGDDLSFHLFRSMLDALFVSWLLGFLIAGWATRPGQDRRSPAGPGDLF
ncbi:hypothetical protein AB0M54_44155 [Actinoplanes sp. NPDC051470]|uniref:hypothetical protein n=1 Tax=unclassified Actinoplanes TaxID=2626549 RepID=UPI003437EB65